MCGEQLTPMILAAVPRGSPPRVRGTDPHGHLLGPAPRITPACAGNSTALGVAVAGVRDHPRVCGEQLPEDTGPSYAEGSPPRVRGTDSANFTRGIAGRITPACAGNSNFFIPFPDDIMDHPRVCGEQAWAGQNLPAVRGSPPRVRGTVFRRGCARSAGGITPACAGNRLI